jgi:hypothetical protein
MAVDLVDHLAIIVAVRRFLSMGAADSRSLRSESYTRMNEFARRSTPSPFRRFLGGVCVVRSRNVFLWSFVARWVPIYLRDAVQGGGAAGVACLPGPEGSGFCAFFLFFFADGFHYFLYNLKSYSLCSFNIFFDTASDDFNYGPYTYEFNF